MHRLNVQDILALENVEGARAVEVVADEPVLLGAFRRLKRMVEVR
jgi:hypothetical protein